MNLRKNPHAMFIRPRRGQRSTFVSVGHLSRLRRGIKVSPLLEKIDPVSSEQLTSALISERSALLLAFRMQ
jgi:hypothetical protein